MGLHKAPRPTHDINVLVNEGDQYHVAELSNVSLLQTPDINVCSNKNVFLVTSAPNNVQLRNQIRKDLKARSGVIFLIGQRDEQISRMLKAENSKNGDILQGTIEDSYRTLAHKIILGFLWIEKNCPVDKRPKFMTKIDDDTELLHEELESALKNIDAEDFVIACPSVQRGIRIWRDSEAPIMGKWTPPDDTRGTK